MLAGNQGHSVRLGYWNIRGLGQRLRMILEYLQIPYTQSKYGNEDEDKWFNTEKPELKAKNPAINLPYLIDGDKVIAQSDAIVVYLIHKANRLELLGRNGDEQVLVATTMGVFRDFHRKYIDLVYGSKQNFEQREKKFVEWKPFLAKLNALLQGKQYYAGGLTWVDFAVAQNMQAVNLLQPTLLPQFPNVLNHQKRIWQLQQLKKYHGSDRWNERPINSPGYACWY